MLHDHTGHVQGKHGYPQQLDQCKGYRRLIGGDLMAAILQTNNGRKSSVAQNIGSVGESTPIEWSTAAPQLPPPFSTPPGDVCTMRGLHFTHSQCHTPQAL
jgi:hypothetical protein